LQRLPQGRRDAEPLGLAVVCSGAGSDAIRKTQVEDVVPILDEPVVAHSVLESVHKNRKESAEPLTRNPITGFVSCCAAAESGQHAAEPLSSVMNSRRFMLRPKVSRGSIVTAQISILEELLVATECPFWVKSGT
jgi:hypothetical protein